VVETIAQVVETIQVDPTVAQQPRLEWPDLIAQGRSG
jgi:hypothetical protein